MILNIVLLFVVFGATKKRFNPYAAAGLLGAIKFALYAAFSRAVVVPLIIGFVYASLAAAFVYFLLRLDHDAGKREDVPVYTSSGSDRMTFRWEYFPLVILLMLIIGGEFMISIILR